MRDFQFEQQRLAQLTSDAVRAARRGIPEREIRDLNAITEMMTVEQEGRLLAFLYPEGRTHATRDQIGAALGAFAHYQDGNIQDFCKRIFHVRNFDEMSERF